MSLPRKQEAPNDTGGLPPSLRSALVAAINKDLPLLLQFVHRNNEDGTVDSICGCCAKTIASSADSNTLTEAEVMHRCL